jgi:hypothetical protein
VSVEPLKRQLMDLKDDMDIGAPYEAVAVVRLTGLPTRFVEDHSPRRRLDHTEPTKGFPLKGQQDELTNRT